jgi:ribonuclease-3
MYRKLHQFQQNVQLSFSSIQLLKQAFTHASYSNEWEGPLSHYQRLEFLGDAILDLLIASKLYYLFPFAGISSVSSLHYSLTLSIR